MPVGSIGSVQCVAFAEEHPASFHGQPLSRQFDAAAVQSVQVGAGDQFVSRLGNRA